MPLERKKMQNLTNEEKTFLDSVEKETAGLFNVLAWNKDGEMRVEQYPTKEDAENRKAELAG